MDRFLNVTEARRDFLGLVEEIEAGDRIVITKRGQPRAVLVDAERYALLEDVAWVMSDPPRRAAMQRALRELNEGDLVAPMARAQPGIRTVRALINRSDRKAKVRAKR